MNDYNRGALPDPCLRLDYGFGDEWKSVELGDGTGYVRLSDYEELKAENDKLREDLAFERSENGWAREFLNRMGRKCGTKDCPSLVAYVNKLEAANAKLRRAFAETLLRLAAANEATVSDYMDDHYCEMLREMRIEVGE